MKSLALAVLLVTAPHPLAADPFHAPAAAGLAGGHRNVRYASFAGHDVVLDWYRSPHASASKRLPAIILLSTLADRSQRDHALYLGWAALATARGMVAVLPDAAPDFDAGFDALLEHLREHAAEMGVDAERIGVYAASANVSRAMPAVADGRRDLVRAAAFFYGYSDSMVFRRDLPVLLVRAGLDRPGMNENLGRVLSEAVAANAPFTLLNLPAAHHGFELLDDDLVSREATERAMDWLKSVLDTRYQAAVRARLPLADAAAAMQRGDAARAAGLYAPLVASSPGDASLRLALGEALLEAGRAKEAREHFEQLRGAGLGPRDLALPAARAALADGDPAAAVAWLRTIPRRFLPASLEGDANFLPLADRADFRALFRP